MNFFEFINSIFLWSCWTLSFRRYWTQLSFFYITMFPRRKYALNFTIEFKRNSEYCITNRYLLRFFDCLAHPNLSMFFATDQKMTLKSSSYLLPKFSRVTLTIVLLILLISTIVNVTLLNFGRRYEDKLRVIFDQWPNLHLGLDALSNQKILNGI